MKKREIQRLKLAKETLLHLQDERVQGAAVWTKESICWCETHLCASVDYTHCDTCTCA